LQNLAGAFSAIDGAMAKIEQSVSASQRSLASQETSLAENQARYTSLTAQIEAARNAIANAAIAFKNDGSAEMGARLAGAQAAYRELVAEAGRLETKLTAQRADVIAAGDAFQGLQNAATAAQIAIGEMGDAGEREGLRTAAAAREAERALIAQKEAAQAANLAAAAAAREEVAQRRAQAAFNQQLGVPSADAPDNTASRRAGIIAAFEEEAEAKRKSAQASKEAAAANDQLDAAAARLLARARPLAVAQDRINAEMKEARDLYNAGKINIRTLAAELERLEGKLKRVDAAQQSVNRNGSAEIKGILGLRPFEMQNLSFQINDVVSGLASGQPPMQVFAQQAGQIVQIFPQFLNFILKYAKGLGLVAIAITPVIIGMSRLAEVAKLQRDFDANLRLSADGARNNTEALIANVEALDDYGASFEDATEAVKTFLAESIRPELIDEFGQAAQNLADITGKDLTEAAADVAKAFSGGYDEIAAFDDQINFLTLSEREQIRAMFESGQESDARALAFARFFDKAEQGARETETSWSRMTKAMGNAWSDFADFLSTSDAMGGLRREMDNAAVGATFLINRLRGLSVEAAALNALGRDEAAKRAANRQGLGAIDLVERATNTGTSDLIDPLDTESARQQKLESDRKFEEEQKKRNRKPRSGGGKSLAELQADFNLEIERTNRNREIQADFTSRTNVLIGRSLLLEQRRQKIAAAIRAAEEQATKDAKRRLTLSEEQKQEIARTVGLEFDAANAKALAQADQQAIEREINNLMERRQALVDSLRFQSPGSAGFNTLQDSIGAIESELEAATEKGIDFWSAIGGDPQQMALLGVNADEVGVIIRDLENTFDSVRQQGLQTVRDSAERGLDDLRNQQRLLLEQINTAQVSGQGGRAGLLQEQLAQVEIRLAEGARKAVEFWRSIKGSPEDLALMGLTPDAVDNIILGLENTIAQAEQLRTQFLATGQALNQDLAGGGTNAMEQFAQSIVNGENVLNSFARAFLQFAADFLLQIARMIAQQAIFNALSGGSAGGAGGAGGGLSSIIGGLFHGGGVVSGKGGRGRAVSASVFSNATRYHNGGFAGFKSNEVPAILERGEEVLTRSDPRHANNGGGKGGGGVSQVLAIGEEQIARAIAGMAGREVVLTHIRQDRATIRKELGID
jgi:DNA repair exonuclease SbcCD ATPase subunit